MEEPEQGITFDEAKALCKSADEQRVFAVIDSSSVILTNRLRLRLARQLALFIEDARNNPHSTFSLGAFGLRVSVLVKRKTRL